MIPNLGDSKVSKLEVWKFQNWQAGKFKKSRIQKSDSLKIGSWKAEQA